MAMVMALCFMLQSPANAQDPDQPGTVALSAAQPELGIPMTATLTDADGSISGTTWQWSSSDTVDGTFAAISGATSATYSPTEADLAKFLRATASYTDALASGKTAMATAANAVHVVDRAFVDNLNNLITGNLQFGAGFATRFETGDHPGGYKLSEITIALLDSYSTSAVSAHIYSFDDSNGRPSTSRYIQLENPSTQSM